MLLETRDGIRCDRCGIICKQDFTYYSYDFHEFQVHNDAMPVIRLQTPTFSIDICQSCMDIIAELVTKNYKPTKMGQDRRFQGGVYCDITGKLLKGTFLLYYCHIIKVKVHTSGLAINCDNCGTTVTNKDEPCPKCNQTQFSRSANTALDKRWLELYIDEATYEDFKQRAVELRTTEAAQWSTSSE